MAAQPEENKTAHVCARCAKRGTTCCSLGQQANGPVECFPISRRERARIEAACAGADPLRTLLSSTPGLGLEPPLIISDLNAAALREGRLFADSGNSQAFIEAMQALFPGEEERINKLFPAGGQHSHLYLPDGGDCVFLSGGGCLLPVPARPWFCRLFPFWTLKGRMHCFAPEECLAVRENPNLPGLLRTFALDKQAVLDTYSSLRRDWGLDD